MTELLVILAFLVGGSVTARILGVKGFALPAIGFIAGVSIYIAIGSLLVITSTPSSVPVAIALTVLIPAALWVLLCLNKRYMPVSVVGTLLAVIVVAAIVVVFNHVHIFNWQVDSFSYIDNGILIFTDQYTDVSSLTGSMKRLLAGPLLLAPAQLVGGDHHYLPSLMPLLAASGVISVVWILRNGLRGRTSKSVLYFGGALTVLLLITNNRFLFHSTNLNTHLLFGVLLVMVVGLGWLLAIKSPPMSPKRLIILQSLLIPTLVVGRAEAVMVVALAILPTILLPNINWRLRAIPLITLGASTILWQGYLLLQHIDRGVDVGIEVLGLLGAGFIMVALTPILRVGWFAARRKQLLWVVESGLWAVLLIFLLISPGILIGSVDATVNNLIYGEGSWGLSIVLLAAATLLIVWYKKSSGPISLRFPLTAFIPLMFLAVYLRGSSYRIGDGDSLNRAWMHILLLAVLYIVVLAVLHSSSKKQEK